jgi:chemotaxis protein methyltransferase CheR
VITTSTLDHLTTGQFSRIAGLVKGIAGIDLRPGKEGLVQSRLGARLRALGLSSYDEYLTRLDGDQSGAELVHMLDVITTNKTSFFREIEHFRLLRDEILPSLAPRREGIRLWSAGCSSGEEPYTAAMVMRDALPPEVFARARILATDLSSRMLARAKKAHYTDDRLGDVPAQLITRHFTPVDGARGERTLQVVNATRSSVRFARLNLMTSWPMRGRFDVIFCRNVMIYFDKATQERLVNRFTELLEPGGYLLVGHSESLTGIQHELRYLQPAVYQR